MDAITDETCEYGLARTHDGCVRTFASFAPQNYQRLQIASVALGLFALCVASYKYVRSVRNHGAKLQQRAFLLSMYASVTFVVRGVDPMGYAHYIPRPVGHFIVDSCTAAIFTVFIMTLSFWVSIIHKGTPTPERTASRIKLLEYSSIAVIWLSKVAVNVSLVWSKGYDVTISRVELFATAALLFGLCIAFAVYGLRVIRRLEYIDKMTARRLSMATHYDTLYTSRVDRLAVSHASTVMSYTDLESQHQDSMLPPVLEAKATTIPRPLKCKKRKPARKIKEMLVITECVSLLCISAQIYTGVQRSNGYKELRCANGFECERLSAHWPLLHGFQYVTIWCVLFTFRKTKRDRNAANALGLTQRVGVP